MCLLAFKFQSKEMLRSCLCSSFSKVCFQEGKFWSPTSQRSDSRGDSESWSESKETWLLVRLRSEEAGFCNSWNSEFSLITWETRTKPLLMFFLLLISVKCVRIFPKCLFHCLLLTRAACLSCGRGVQEGETRQERSNEDADARGRRWEGSGSRRWVGKMRERKTKIKGSDIRNSCKASKQELGK